MILSIIYFLAIISYSIQKSIHNEIKGSEKEIQMELIKLIKKSGFPTGLEVEKLEIKNSDFLTIQKFWNAPRSISESKRGIETFPKRGNHGQNSNF